jgi:hypothetical protein
MCRHRVERGTGPDQTTGIWKRLSLVAGNIHAESDQSLAGRRRFVFELAGEVVVPTRLDSRVGWPREIDPSSRPLWLRFLVGTDIRRGRCHSYSCISCCHTAQELDLGPRVPLVQVLPKWRVHLTRTVRPL